MTKKTKTAIGALTLMMASLGQAQEDGPIESYMPPKAEKSETEKTLGWDQYLGSSFYGSTSQNSDVVGKDDGVSTTLGLKLDGDLDYTNESDEWRNGFDLILAYSRTPQLPDYLKTEDNFKLESLYLFHLPQLHWAGPFVRFSAETAMATGYLTRPSSTTFSISRTDGTTETVDTDRLKMTDPFRPLRLKESIGFFAQPYNKPIASVEVRTGLGYRHLFANDQLVLDDDSDTDALELKEIQNYRTAGAEFGLEAKGKTDNKRVSYTLSGDVLLPYYEDPETEDKKKKSVFDKRIIEINGKVSFHLVEWASVDYVLRAIRDPNVKSKTQQTQSVLFSVNHVFAPRNSTH